MEELLQKICIAVGVRVDYFDRLFALAKERIKQCYDKQEYNVAFLYMTNLVTGTVAKFAELEGELFPTYVLHKLGFGNGTQMFINFEDDTNYNTAEILWDDIFVALGHDLVDYFAVGEINGVEERLMGVEQLVELNKVWESADPEHPLREMIALLRNMNLKNMR